MKATENERIARPDVERKPWPLALPAGAEQKGWARLGRQAPACVPRRRLHPLSRDVVVVSAIKLAVIVLLYGLFFTPAHRLAVSTAVHIAGFGQPASAMR